MRYRLSRPSESHQVRVRALRRGTTLRNVGPSCTFEDELRQQLQKGETCLLTTRWSGPGGIVAAPSAQWIAGLAARSGRRAWPLNSVVRRPERRRLELS